MGSSWGLPVLSQEWRQLKVWLYFLGLMRKTLKLCQLRNFFYFYCWRFKNNKSSMSFSGVSVIDFEHVFVNIHEKCFSSIITLKILNFRHFIPIIYYIVNCLLLAMQMFTSANTIVVMFFQCWLWTSNCMSSDDFLFSFRVWYLWQ